MSTPLANAEAIGQEALGIVARAGAVVHCRVNHHADLR